MRDCAQIVVGHCFCLLTLANCSQDAFSSSPGCLRSSAVMLSILGDLSGRLWVASATSCLSTGSGESADWVPQSLSLFQ